MLILTINANPVNQHKTYLEACAKETVFQAYNLHNHTKRSLKKAKASCVLLDVHWHGNMSHAGKVSERKRKDLKDRGVKVVLLVRCEQCLETHLRTAPMTRPGGISVGRSLRE